MTINRKALSLSATGRIAGLVMGGASILALTGCFGPTYGTDKPSGSQLFEDLGSSLALKKVDNGPPIVYSPRPDIVKPTDTATLPAPQTNIVDASGQWPESPEQRRKRVLAEIEEGKRDPNFVTNPKDVAATGASDGPAANAGGARRVFLTDPPTEYRIPAQTAEYGGLGETEASKARAASAAQGKKQGWRRLVPWL